MKLSNPGPRSASNDVAANFLEKQVRMSGGRDLATKVATKTMVALVGPGFEMFEKKFGKSQQKLQTIKKV